MRCSESPPVGVALLDDHVLIREALKIRLSSEPNVEVRGIYATSQALIGCLRNLEVDVVILDYQLTDGELDGLRLIQLIRSHYPRLKIIVFSSSERPATINMTLRAGANAFVGKSQETVELLHAIREVMRGRIYIAPSPTPEPGIPLSTEAIEADQTFSNDDALLSHPGLSVKETEVLRCCLKGMSVTQIAVKFSRSPKTISAQKQSALRKLGIQTDNELFKLQFHLRRV